MSDIKLAADTEDQVVAQIKNISDLVTAVIAKSILNGHRFKIVISNDNDDDDIQVKAEDLTALGKTERGEIGDG